jgi:glyoxylate utilization-related uncharacterized protein
MKIFKGIAVTLTAALLVSGGGVATSLATAPSAQAASTQSEIDVAVNQILNETNAERVKAGLAPLKLNASINTVAQNWSQSMAAQNSMYHNPNYQFQMPQPWMRVGENVGQGYTSSTIVAAWMASPGHKANILGDFTHIGLGYWIDDSGRGWFTQNFGKYDVPTLTEINEPTTTVGKFDVTATWDRKWEENVKDYKAELHSSEGVLIESKIVPVSNSTVTFNGLTDLTSYNLKIVSQSTNSLGERFVSPVKTVTVTTLENLPTVTAPTDLTLVPGENTLAVSWTAPADLNGTLQPYKVELYKSGALVDTLETVSTSHTFTNLTANTGYTVKVIAIASVRTKTATATAESSSKTLLSSVPVAIKAPNAPTVFKASPAYNDAKLTWVAPTGIVGNLADYTVTVKQSGKADRTFKVTGTSYTISGLVENTSYTVTVVANVLSTDGANAVTSPSASTAMQTFARFIDSKYSSFPREVDWMKTAGISTGYWDGTYDPYGTVTREQMAAFMYRMAGRPAFTATAPFTDAKYSSFPTEVNWMKTAGISTGYWDGRYDPFSTVNREQMAAFMHRYATKVCSVNVPASKYFVDTKYSSFPAEVSWMGGAGISTGYWDGTYRPYDPVTREQMAAFMYRLNNYIESNGGCKR